MTERRAPARQVRFSEQTNPVLGAPFVLQKFRCYISLGIIKSPRVEGAATKSEPRNQNTMNPTTRIVCCVGIALLTSSGISHAENSEDNLYLHADIGPAFFESAPTTARTVTPSGRSGTIQRGHTDFDTEIRADLSLGYHLTKCFSLEAEAGFIWDPNENGNNYFYQIPVMLNGIYQIPLGRSWSTYLGAGAGAVIGRTHSVFRQPAFHERFVFDDSDWSAGYQAEAGIKYALSRNIDIDLGYKFLGIAQYDFQFRNVSSPGSEKIPIDDLFIHSVQASFTFKF
jgi:opacity protein-like surface antigen